MRTIKLATFSLALVGCVTMTNADTAIAGDGTLTGFLREFANPGSTDKAQQAADDAKCRRYGFKQGTDAYGNCRLQLDRSRSAARAAASNGNREGLSSLCKDAISRRDSGGTFIHC